MKINILSPIFKGKLTQKINNKVSKSFRYNIIIDNTRETIDSIIILGNGNVAQSQNPVIFDFFSENLSKHGL